MDKLHYEEMVSRLDELIERRDLQNKKVYLFGHCNATEELAKLLLDRGFAVEAILDNNTSKQGRSYHGIIIKSPHEVIKEKDDRVAVCIVARAYAAMAEQLERIGYRGSVYKLADYNSYAEYSLSEETISRMTDRRRQGERLLMELDKKYPDYFRILCPFSALGDIYIMMSYLPHYMKKRGIGKCVVGVVGNACAQIVQLFGTYSVEVFSQKHMDEIIQAALYKQDRAAFIPHQDRPYVINLHKALYMKCISLEKMYRSGVFGLPVDTQPVRPTRWKEYADLHKINKGKAVLFSPYAKSVPIFPEIFWQNIVSDFRSKGYQCLTNVAGDEKPLAGTTGISPRIAELKSVVERAGTFVGIRSGLCDVLKDAKGDKTALYPDYNYCDTKWKAIDVYAIDGWKNIVADEDFLWDRN